MKANKEQKKKIYNHLLMEQAMNWASIGVKVNPCFFENSYRFTTEDVIRALKHFGIEYDTLPRQCKWYHFWKNEKLLRVDYAISLIK